MRFIIVVVALMSGAISSAAISSRPCRGVGQFAGADDPVAAPAIARQVGMVRFSIERTYRAGQWRVYFTRDPSDGYLFFRGSPRTSKLAYVWGGIAQPAELDIVRRRIKAGVPGVPASLASCIARAATGR